MNLAVYKNHKNHGTTNKTRNTVPALVFFPSKINKFETRKGMPSGALKALINFCEDYHDFTNPKNSERPFWGGTS